MAASKHAKFLRHPSEIASYQPSLGGHYGLEGHSLQHLTELVENERLLWIDKNTKENYEY